MFVYDADLPPSADNFKRRNKDNTRRQTQIIIVQIDETGKQDQHTVYTRENNEAQILRNDSGDPTEQKRGERKRGR